MLKNMRIASKFNLVAMMLVYTALLTVALAAFFSASNALKLAGLQHLESIAALKVEKIRTFIVEKKADIEVVQGYFNIKTNLPLMSQYQDDRSNPIYLRAKKMLDGQLSVFHTTYKFLELMLLNQSGEVVYTANPAHFKKTIDRLLPDPSHQAFEEGKKKIYVSKIFRDSTEGFKFFISAPIYDFQETWIGVVVFGIDLDSNFRFIQETTGLGKTGETLIGLDSSEGLIFLNTRRHEINENATRGQSDAKDRAYPMRQAVQGKEGNGISVDYRGQEVLAVWKFIPELKLGLVAKIDVEETYAPVTQLGRIILLIATIVLGITLILSSWLSRTLSEPIIQLSHFAKRVASGDLAHRISLDSKDEIGQLAAEYNHMTQALSEAQASELAKNLKHSKAQNRQLELQAKALEESNQELEQFTYVVSHDLKAPFRAIQNYSDFLTKDLQGKLEEEQESYLAGLGEAVRDGEQFLEDLLTLSRLGKKQLGLKKLPIRDFLNELIASLHFPPEIEFVLPEEGPGINLEPTLARQIFQNLIQNGVKFNQSPKKQIEIGWQLIEETHNEEAHDEEIHHEQSYELYIKDNGIGIDPRFFERIFLPFQQLHPSDVFGGSGIGLATVKKAAAILQWTIRVESEIGQGSVFFIKISAT